MRIALAADHGGFDMKQMLIARLRAAGHQVTDFGAERSDPEDDYPDYIIPLARAVVAGEADRGIVICGSGVGASVAANKVKGIRAGLCPNGRPSLRSGHAKYSAAPTIGDTGCPGKADLGRHRL